MFYSFFNSLIKGYLKYRHSRIQSIYANPLEMQEEVFINLTDKLQYTEYGKKYSKKAISSISEFKKAYPIVNYECIFPFIDKMIRGEENILWPGKVQWFAKSSGTTNDRSKYIPITDDNLFENHVASSWDAMSIIYNNQPDAKIFEKKNLLMGGSLSHINENLIVGDVSAILLSRMPAIGRPFYSPDFETALLADWEEKIEKTALQSSKDDIVMFAGVPTWTICLFKKILEVTGKSNMREVWPNVKTYFHGGVGFDPYVDQFKTFLPGDDIHYYEVYNASEGYFAVQDRSNEKGMILLLANSIFYEFIPLEHMDDEHPETLNINEVELEKDYCIVISTSSGLWRYKPGDVVRFVSVAPYRIMVSGRTKHFINVFGEEVMVANTDRALKETCEICDGKVRDYTVAPVFMQNNSKGGHQWLIEFDENPSCIDKFTELLDLRLRSINSDYDAKRHKDIALQNLQLDIAPIGTFNKWLQSKGKLGGQSKILRLSNDRNFIEQLQQFIQQNN
ncbi:MAG: GH3 auxin-responsive promoter family protein [Saprospiraceae bacterium]|nr:GH3 auxin-responsive promoter family protein [Saprospiraceae bacterium]